MPNQDYPTGYSSWHGCPIYGSPGYPAHVEDEKLKFWYNISLGIDPNIPPDDPEFNGWIETYESREIIYVS
ncbi:MAG: hypothetical protein QW761_02570, partial [Candidatus Aenigmatarchaeota archaeon]